MNDVANTTGRSPAWARDELILALDHFVQRGGSRGLNARSPGIVELSKTIRGLPIFPKAVRQGPSFRSPSSVSLKLHNLAAVEPASGEGGLAHVGRGDHWVWERWGSDPQALVEVANLVRYLADDGSRHLEEAVEGEEEHDAGRLACRHAAHQAAVAMAATHTTSARCASCGTMTPAAGLRVPGYESRTALHAPVRVEHLHCIACTPTVQDPLGAKSRPSARARPDGAATLRDKLITASSRLDGTFDVPSLMSATPLTHWGTERLATIRAALDDLAAEPGSLIVKSGQGRYAHVAGGAETTRAPVAASASPSPGATTNHRERGLGGAREWIIRTASGSHHPFDFPTLCRWADDDPAARHMPVPLLREALMSLAADASSPVERVRRGFYAHRDQMPAASVSSASPMDVLVEWAKEKGTDLFTWRDLKRRAIALDVNHDLVALKRTLLERTVTSPVDDGLPRFDHHGSSYFRLSRTATEQSATADEQAPVALTTHPVAQDSGRRRGGGTDRERIKTLRASGLTLQQIATDQGVTRERIRQILLQESFTPEDFRAAREVAQESERRATLLRAVEVLRSDPGVSVETLAEKVGVPTSDLSRILPQDLRRLTISSRDGTANERLTDDQAVAAIAEAGTYEYPLTAKMYTELLRAGLIDGLSIPRISQRFGSWREACERAGVEAGSALRAEYTRRWSTEDMAETMADFLAETDGSVAVTAFDEWAATHPDMPSSQTVRNCFRGWNEAKVAGLTVLAGRDEFWRNLAARLAPPADSSTIMSDDAGSIIVDSPGRREVDK